MIECIILIQIGSINVCKGGGDIKKKCGVRYDSKHLFFKKLKQVNYKKS